MISLKLMAAIARNAKGNVDEELAYAFSRRDGLMLIIHVRIQINSLFKELGRITRYGTE